MYKTAPNTQVRLSVRASEACVCFVGFAGAGAGSYLSDDFCKTRTHRHRHAIGLKGQRRQRRQLQRRHPRLLARTSKPQQHTSNATAVDVEHNPQHNTYTPTSNKRGIQNTCSSPNAVRCDVTTTRTRRFYVSTGMTTIHPLSLSCVSGAVAVGRIPIRQTESARAPPVLQRCACGLK